MQVSTIISGFKKMKILITTFAGLCMILSVTSGQVVTLKELINETKCNDYACFNDFITAKGFCFDKTNTVDGIGTFYQFNSCDIIKDGPKGLDTKNQAGYTVLNSGSIQTSIGTSSNKYYQQLLNELKRLGFKSYKTDDTDPTNIHIQYKSSAYPKIDVMFTTSKAVKEGFGSWTYWNFNFSKSK